MKVSPFVYLKGGNKTNKQNKKIQTNELITYPELDVFIQRFMNELQFGFCQLCTWYVAALKELQYFIKSFGSLWVQKQTIGTV